MERITVPDVSQVINGSLELHNLTRKTGLQSCPILGASTIRCLELSADLITALKHEKLESRLPIFGRLTHLKVHSSWCNNKCIRLLMELLKRAPALEKLMFASLPGNGNYEKIKLKLMKCTSHLKVVEFEDFPWIAEEEQLDLVKFWLQNLLAMEKVIIKTRSWRFNQVKNLFLCYPNVQVICL